MEEEQINEQTEVSMLDKATKIAERIEAANKITEDLVLRQEKVQAHKIISGKTEAGIPPIAPKVDEFAGARQMLKGTGYESMFPPVEK